MGVSRIPAVVIKTTPEKSAYAEAKNLAESEFKGFTGPMPVRIIIAFKIASTQLNSAMKC